MCSCGEIICRVIEAAVCYKSPLEVLCLHCSFIGDLLHYQEWLDKRKHILAFKKLHLKSNSSVENRGTVFDPMGTECPGGQCSSHRTLTARGAFLPCVTDTGKVSIRPIACLRGVVGARTLLREAVRYRELNDSGPSGCENGLRPPGWAIALQGSRWWDLPLSAQLRLEGMGGYAQPSRLIAGNLCWAVRATKLPCCSLYCLLVCALLSRTAGVAGAEIHSRLLWNNHQVIQVHSLGHTNSISFSDLNVFNCYFYLLSYLFNS